MLHATLENATLPSTRTGKFGLLLDSLKSGNITGQYQMSPELSRKIGTFDNDRGTNDIAQGHLIVTSQYQLSQRDVLRTFDID